VTPNTNRSQAWEIAVSNALRTREYARKCGLVASGSYWKATGEDLAEMTGGCGPGKFGDYLVPDTMYGLSVKAACQIHDWDYRPGSEITKTDADMRFLVNMIRIIKYKTRFKVVRIFRYLRAVKYYAAVDEFGGGSYTGPKHNPEPTTRNP